MALLTILLLVIIYLLYQILKQLTYLTGIRYKLPFAQKDFSSLLHRKEKPKPTPTPEEKEENLPN